jgi:hypothetical protein
MRRPHAVWKPWVLAGGGVALAGVGVLFRRAAQRNNDQYRDDLSICGEVGCLPEEIPASVTELESRAKTQNGFAIAAWIGAGVAVVGGVAWALRNYPRPSKQRRPTTIGAGANGDGAFVSLTHRF